MDSDGTKDEESLNNSTSVHLKGQSNGEDEEVDYVSMATSSCDDAYPAFECLIENIYLGNKKKRVNKEIRRMSCDCTYYPDEHEFVGCGEDCLNRLLMIECNSRCPTGEFCSNRKFHEGQKYQVEAFKTQRKGWGLRAVEDIPANQFVLEYCGEVMGYDEFEKRVETYDKENRKHYYFMTLRADEIIDATYKGNISRFINHSCSPNCETQKWTVNGYLRIGFFSTKNISAGTEVTFDYKFQRYGKKAQFCHCESTNCRGIIGGEKHTPLKSIISGRAASPAPANSPRRNRRRRLAEQFNDKPLEFEFEIAQLLGNTKGIRNDEQALKLSQFMVRAGTSSQRVLLLDTLWATEDQNCLRSFVRYQGLSLLWSWMVDLGENSQHIQKKIVQVLTRLPVSNLNQVQDTKVLKVIRKWARKPSATCVAEEETSSSDMDSRGFSPLGLSDDVAKRDGNISSTSGSDIDLQSKSETKRVQILVSDDSVDTAKPETLSNDEKMTEDMDKTDKTVETSSELVLDKTVETSSELVLDKTVETSSEQEKQVLVVPPGDSTFEGCVLKTAAKLPEGRSPKLGDSSEEEESRWSEDDSASSDHEAVTELAADLLNRWSSLKEVYRIPKKSTIVEKCEPESTSSIVEAVVTEPICVRVVPKIPIIPTIDGDLFQKDEFISKLGERELSLDQKPPGQQESTTLPADIPMLMSSGVLTASEQEEVGNDPGKIPIHQRLQMVASNGPPAKQYAIWQGKGGGKRAARKHPYAAAGGTFQPGAEKWAARHHGGPAQNQAMNPSGGPPGPNLPANQWPVQSPYPGTYQYPQPGGCPQSSVGYSTQATNLATTQPSHMQASYYATAQDVQAGALSPYQPSYSTQGTYNLGASSAPPMPSEQAFGPAINQLASQTGIVTNPLGYQQVQQSVNQAHYSLLAFDPSKPPPNFVPSQNNVQQFPNAVQTHLQNTASQFPNATPSYPATHPIVPNVPNYPLQPPQQVSVQAISQTATPSEPGPQHLSVSTTAMVSSTVHETLTKTVMDVVGSNPADWSLGKPRDVSLPSDWKLAYDGECRAYYYHVITRQTQWDPPVADRSPPTPELGYLGDELDCSLEMTTAFSTQMVTDVVMDVVDSTKRKKPKTPSTPPGSPPKSPVGKYTTAAADTTDVRKGLYSPSLLLQEKNLTPEQRKRRETFRMKLSAVVVNYLNPYHKIDCKEGRIATVDDFKFLARKLTHGVMVKELSRLKDESVLACNDSVKIKTKEYIRHYMHKFGPVYKAS